MDEKTSHEANLFFHSNIENAVYFDLLLYQGCYEQSPVSLNFDTRQDSEVPNASINLEIIRSKLADKTLTYAGDPGADVNAERIRGVFFLKGEIDAGTFFLEALPVPYSSDAQRKFTCTKSLSETSDRSYLKKAEAYVRSCIFEQPWDPWGWGTLN
ncbi:MAG: hypothetical protein NXI02_03125 [Rhodobacteraceae bacterium]|nr:hypothetical protein [Paracoccaceae bacterium]